VILCDRRLDNKFIRVSKLSVRRRMPPGNLAPVSYPLENALFQWEEGRRALQAIEDPRLRRLSDRVVDAIREELRRRIGPTFTAAELADLYGEGTDWAQTVALDVAPSVEGDAQALADAAFWLYLRGATDFAGGRQLPV
jgi:hypothetical protein